MKTVALIACSDTKHAEIIHVSGLMRKWGIKPLILDPSTSPGYVSPYDLGREVLVAEVGLHWAELEGKGKHELLEAVAEGCAAMAVRLYAEGRIQGVFCMGGLQNTTVGSRAMKRLPIGVPKVIVSTVASGQRTFDLVVGTRDILVMPSICDLAGMNAISENVLANAVAAFSGMLEKAGRELRPPHILRVATTLMGATNDGVDRAAELVRGAGIEVAAFHSTGVGGQVLEEMIDSGVITAAMDLTLHEVVYEYFGRGFGYGANNRLKSAAARGIPMVVTPGGIDFMCQWKHELFPDIAERKMIWHNAQLAHVKLNAKEVTDISRIIVERLNESTGPVEVVLPFRGLRSFTNPGEALHDPDLDRLIFSIFEQELKKDIPVHYVDATIMDPAYSELAAKTMLRMLGK